MASIVRFLGFAVLFPLCFSCGGDGGSSASGGSRLVRLAVGTVDAAGGTVQVTKPSSPYAGTSIVVPPGAVAAPTEITLSRIVNGAYPSNVFEFKLEPEGQQFTVPVTLTLKYSGDYLSDTGLTNESALQIVQRSSNSGPEVLTTLAQDFANDTITVQTSHFSSFAALAYNNQTLKGEYFVVTWVRLPPVPDPVPTPFPNPFPPPGYTPTRHFNEVTRTSFDGEGNYSFLGGQKNQDGTVTTMSGSGGTYSVGPTGRVSQTPSGEPTYSGAVLLSGDMAVMALPFGSIAEIHVLIRKNGVYDNASLSGDYFRAKMRHDITSSNTSPPPDPLVDVCVAEPGTEFFDGAGLGGLYSVSSDGTIISSPADPQRGGLGLGGLIMAMGSVGAGQDPEITVFAKRAGVFSQESLNGTYVLANFSYDPLEPPPDHWSDVIEITFDGAGGWTSGGAGTYTIAPDGAVDLVAPGQTMVGSLLLGGAILLLNGTTHPEIAVCLRQSEPPTTKRVSIATGGTEALGGSSFTWPGCLSGDGRYTAFESDATNLVAGDSNGLRDIFVHDRVTQTTTRVSVDSVGNQALGGDSQKPGISADGRYVCFHSAATNLVANDLNGGLDVFVHDRQTGATTRVSVDSMGNEAAGGSNTPNISADGRFVTFTSSAPDLVAMDGNGTEDAFLHDRNTGETIRVSVDSSEVEVVGNAAAGPVSDDGNIVLFQSDAAGFVAGDGNGVTDVFVRDVAAGTTTRVSVSSLGVEADFAVGFGGMSADGRYICLGSSATTLVAGDANNAGDVFVHDRQSGQTTRVSVGPLGVEGIGGGAGDGRISANGRFVSFGSFATNLVPGDTNGVMDAFVHDRLTGLTTRVSLSSTGQPTGVNAFTPTISRNGRFVAFRSGDPSLVPSDGNSLTDVFLRGPLF